jgi:hypothetical protein
MIERVINSPSPKPLGFVAPVYPRGSRRRCLVWRERIFRAEKPPLRWLLSWSVRATGNKLSRGGALEDDAP